MPATSRGSPVFSAGRGVVATPMGLIVAPTIVLTRFLLSGLTLDSAGAVLGNCTVLVFETATNVFRASTISDAGGNWTVEVTGGASFFAVMYLPGSPDVMGTSVNTLVGTG